MRHTRLYVALAALLLFVGMSAISARAADKEPDPRGIYGGVGFGLGFFEDVRDPGEPGKDEFNTQYAWRIMVWWRAHKWMSMEIGYVDAGEPGRDDQNSGLHLALEPTFPLPGDMDIMVRVGGFFPGLSNEDVAGGVGLAYHPEFAKGFGLRLDYDRLGLEDSDPIDVLTLGFFYQLSR